ncbi:MAG: MBL fold metallo-hydrolase [Devosiaceae bacterium]|nr:MBL fold metallo-hydrolase [Devosiaceae bacterium]
MSERAQFFTVTVLGCGSSGGVPRIGNIWGACDASNPKNRRRRCSILIRAGRYDNGELASLLGAREEGKSSNGKRTSGGGAGDGSKATNGGKNKELTTNILIDSGCDIREQLLDANIEHLDAVFYTHEHADHIHGIDDLRVLALTNKKRIEVYMAQACAKQVMSAFSYCFNTPVGSNYKPILNANLISDGNKTKINGAGGSIEIEAFLQDHGNIKSLGFRIGDFAYSCDLSALPLSSHKALKGVKLWLLDALRYRVHPCHLNVEQSVALIDELNVPKAYLTNLHIDLDYEILKNELPKHIEPAYDGLEIKMKL